MFEKKIYHAGCRMNELDPDPEPNIFSVECHPPPHPATASEAVLTSGGLRKPQKSYFS